MFIRIKKVKSWYYAYAVINHWTKRGARQKTAGYLGKVEKLEPKQDLSFNQFIAANNIALKDRSAKEIVKKYVAYELYKHGFLEDVRDKDIWRYQDITVDLQALRIAKQGSKVVLNMNNDFLCDMTLKNLINFRSEADEEVCGKELAQAFISAGIPIEPEIFIEVFRNVFKPGDISYMV